MQSGRDNESGRIGAVIYTMISLGIAIGFAMLAEAAGRYSPVAIYGGAAWTFLLSMIVTMPTVTPLVVRYRAKRSGAMNVR